MHDVQTAEQRIALLKKLQRRSRIAVALSVLSLLMSSLAVACRVWPTLCS